MQQLTDRKIQSLKPPKNGGSYDVKDTQVPGLAVRVYGTQRTFVMVARFPGQSNPTRRAIGPYGALSLEQARSKGRQWRDLIRRGIDPAVQEERDRQAALRRQHVTFAAVAEDFIRDKLPSERKGREVELDIRREFLPLWGKRPVTEITALDVRNVVKAAVDRGAPYQAHNLLTEARRLFSWAIDQHVYGLESSPCDRLKPKALAGARKPRKRVLDDDELRALWRASKRLDYPYGPLFQMLLLTGQRKSEVAEARWSEFDLTKKLWTIPAERMKADAAHVVPLSDDVLAILHDLPRFKSGDCLFSATFGKTPVNGFSKAKSRLDAAMAAELGKAVPPFVIHDIRRTMRTGLSALPVPDLIRELVIAHTKPGLHKVYDQHAYAAEKRHALELWARRLRSIIDWQTGSNVTPLRTVTGA
jgi:integrase